MARDLFKWMQKRGLYGWPRSPYNIQKLVEAAYEKGKAEATPQPDTVEPVGWTWDTNRFGRQFTPLPDVAERLKADGVCVLPVYTHPPANINTVVVDARAELERLRNLAFKSVATSHAEEDAALVEICNGLRALLDQEHNNGE